MGNQILGFGKDVIRMRNRIRIRKQVSLLSAFCIAAQAALTLSAVSPAPAEAAGSFRNAAVSSAGSKDTAAIIRGSAAEVVYDSTRRSNVLSLGGGAFGAGWLQLPEVFSAGCGEGFSLSMDFQLASDAASYSRLYQFAAVPLGTGSTAGYSSPDLSIDLNDKSAFRTSVFAGTGSATADDGAHRSIFTLSAKPDTDWHTLTVSYAPAGAAYYLDGKALSKDSSEGASQLSAACGSLFSENLLKNYVYNGIGHSLYNDEDIHGKVDNIRFYGYALSAAQAADLPDDAQLWYAFEEGQITESDEPDTAETAFAPDRTEVTSIPALETVSPGGSLTVKFWTDAAGRYYYTADKGSKRVIEPSRIGLVTATEDLSAGFSADAPEAAKTKHDETYEMPYGKHTVIRDCYAETSFPLQKGSSTLTVTLRAYDDGLGLRYALNHGASIKEEATQVMFPGNSKFWGNWPNATYEWNMVELPTERGNETNATYSCPYTGVIDGKYWVTVSEAGVFNEENPYCAGALQFVGNYHSLRFKGGVKVSGISMSDAFHTPWRAVIIGADLNEMASSDLILNLNPPSVLDDISWVKPGKLAWSWWSSGGDSPVEYHMQKEYIDFAAANGWDYVCVDFGWALWDDSAAKIKELCDYGKEKGIGIWLWYGVNNSGHSGYKDSAGHPAYPYYSLLDEATIKREFERVSRLGVRGVKVDYYESDTQETMKQMYLCMKIAAENKLMVLFHGCTIPRGESRTFPNVISFEAINGTEYYKWFDSPSLENRVSYTFTRCVVGSADFTPTGIPVYGIKATAGFALADTVTIESGLQHFAHSVYTYEGSPALPFLNDVPVKWDDLCVLEGMPMQYNTTARRSGNDWYVGASTIRAREATVDLSKLISDDGLYNAYIYHDNANGSAVELTVQTGLTKDSVIKQELMNNGGFVMKLTQGTMQTETPYANYKSYEAEQAKLGSDARITSGSDGKYCSNNAYVGYVGGRNGGTVTFDSVEAPADGEYTLRIYYVSGEPRSLKVDVNGAFAAKLDNCYANKGDWKGIRAVSVSVKLRAGKNTVRLYNDQGDAPSVDRIALALPPDDILYGDMNFDGRLDARDLALLKRGLLGEFSSEKQQKAADFNRDGKRDAADAEALMRFLTARS